MSEQDRYSMQATELLPCTDDCHDLELEDPSNIFDGTLKKRLHFGRCPHRWRPAVAAALRAQGQEIERLRIAASEATVDETEDYIRSKETDIAQLKAQLGAMDKALKAHRRFHGKVGCPGDGCYVCDADDAATAQPGPSDGVFNEVRKP